MLGPAYLGTAQAPFAAAVGIPNPLPVFGAAMGPGVSVLPTLLGLRAPPAPQRVLKPSRDVRSLAVLQLAVGRTAGRRHCPAGERLGRCVY